METSDRFLTIRKAEFFLLGLRGTGKYTFIKRLIPMLCILICFFPMSSGARARPQRPREAIYDRGTERLKRDDILIEPALIFFTV